MAAEESETMDESKRMAPTISRRTILGAAAAIVGTELPPPSARAAESPHKPAGRDARHTDYDVVVIGGGFSGVTASRDLQKNGLQTLLLEAKGRLGGRTFDTQFRGRHIELGGTWVHWAQPAVWSEILRYGVEIEDTAGAAPEHLMVWSGEDRLIAEKPAQFEEIFAGLTKYFEDSAIAWERPYDTHFRWKEIEARDSMSALDHLKKTELTPLQRAFVAVALECQSHTPIAQTSYTDMLRWIALCMNNVGLAPDALSRYKLSAGTGALVRKIAADGKAEIRLDTPVAGIEQKDGAVIVSPRTGSPVSARAVVLAVPPRVLKDLHFSPMLSEAKLTASRIGFPSSGIKLYAEVKGRMAKSQWGACGRKRGNGLYWTYQESNDTSLVVGFCPSAHEFDGNDEASVQEVLRQFDPHVEVLASTSYGWDRDPFAQGTYTGLAPGGHVRFFDDLARPEGRIWMAGGDIGDNSWRGFIDGAIARGSRIAREVSEALLA
jgi:pseudooxynicotine oxidase